MGNFEAPPPRILSVSPPYKTATFRNMVMMVRCLDVFKVGTGDLRILP